MAAELLEGLDAIGDALGLAANTEGEAFARRRRVARWIKGEGLPAHYRGGTYFVDPVALATWWASSPAVAPRRRRVRRRKRAHVRQ